MVEAFGTFWSESFLRFSLSLYYYFGHYNTSSADHVTYLSGIGLAIGQRLIDEFLATRSLTSHLVLVPTTRSVSKCRDTIDSLRAYAEQTAQASTALRSRYGQEEEEEKTRAAGGEGQTDGGVHAAGYRWQDAAARIHIVSITLDLNDLRSLAATATQLRESVVGNPPGVEGPDGRIKAVRIPRFDSIIFNAGYGGWVGLDFVQAIWKFLIQGPIVAATWPTFKLPLPTGVLNKQPQLNYVRFALRQNPLLKKMELNVD
jgi:3-keto steroid reductase